MHYGFIGLGNLGSKLAARLAENGFCVTGFDTNTRFTDSLEQAGVTFAASPQELASAVDHVITCLPSPDASSAVLDQILGAMGSNASVIEMSTIGREDAIRFAGCWQKRAGSRLLWSCQSLVACILRRWAS